MERPSVEARRASGNLTHSFSEKKIVAYISM